MSLAGRALLRFNRWRECRKFQAVLSNGEEVFHQKSVDDEGRSTSIIDGLAFHNGPHFKIRDGAGAAHIFHEIFLQDQYPRALLAGANTIVDVGANIGLFSYFARLNAPKAARIIAIEADPDTFAVLNYNLASQNIDRIHQAVASTTGAIDFYSSETSGWSSRYPVLGAASARKVSVHAEPLSATLRNRGIGQIDFLKIDVEGAEYDIILGDKALFEFKIGAMIVEADRSPRDSQYTMRELLDSLRARFRSVSVGSGNYPLVTCLA